MTTTVDKSLHFDVRFTQSDGTPQGPFTVHVYLLNGDGSRKHIFTTTDVKLPYHYTGNLLARGRKYLVEVADQQNPQFSKAIFTTSGSPQPDSDDKEGPFMLRKGAIGTTAKEPATISFLKDRGKDTTYALDFAVLSNSIGRQELSKSSWLTGSASFEGHLGSPGLSEQALRLRLGGLINTTSYHAVVVRGEEVPKQDFGTRTSFNFKFETDQALRSKKVSGELLFEPSKFGWGMRQFYPTAEQEGDDLLPLYQFVWRPVLGLEGGGTLESANSKERDSTLLRAKAQVGGIFRTNPRRGILRHIDFTADDVFYFLPLESGRTTFNYFQAGVIFHFDDTYSFNVNYKVGEDAPTFQKVETIQGAFGIKFN